MQWICPKDKPSQLILRSPAWPDPNALLTDVRGQMPSPVRPADGTRSTRHRPLSLYPAASPPPVTGALSLSLSLLFACPYARTLARRRTAITALLDTVPMYLTRRYLSIVPLPCCAPSSLDPRL